MVAVKTFRRVSIGVVLSVLTFSMVFSWPVSAQSAQEKPKIVAGTAPQTDPTSGVEMFNAYCAVCHGRDAKGNGPAATALKVAPPDLTRLSAMNKGVFPQVTFEDAVRRGPSAHGSAEMPVWGPVFRYLGDDQQVTMRISNLRRYVEGLQVK